jgi:hypothetical protein
MIAFNVLSGICDTRITAIKRFFTDSSGRALKMVECDFPVQWAGAAWV